MDRILVQPGAAPLAEDSLEVQQFVMIALGRLARALYGDGISVDGLECIPTVPASLSVVINPGMITGPTVIDATAFSTLPPNTNPCLKIGINISTSTFTLAPPVTLGQAINYRLCATFQEIDNGPTVGDYYNAANPGEPLSGPGGGGAAVNRYRRQLVDLQVVAGAPAIVGTQLTPACPSGWVPLFTITVNNGQTQITSDSIVQDPSSPVAQFRLPQLTPGYSRMVVLSASTTFTVPNGVNAIRITILGGGGGGGGANPNEGGAGFYLSGAGGGAGGYATGAYVVTPGQQLPCIVGLGGLAGIGANAGVIAGGGEGGTGGTSSVGSMIAATGGQGGLWPAITSSAGGDGGSGFGGTLNCVGSFGSDGQNGALEKIGNGAASVLGGDGRAGAGGGAAASSPGSGGGAGYDAVCNGGAGADGVIIIEF